MPAALLAPLTVAFAVPTSNTTTHDVVVIGAGYAGLVTARRLAATGADVGAAVGTGVDCCSAVGVAIVVGLVVVVGVLVVGVVVVERG